MLKFLRILPVLALVGGCLGVFALRHGRPLLRKGVICAVPILIAALITPEASLTEPQWAALVRPGAGNRYFFIPMLAWIGICVSLIRAPFTPVRLASRAFLILLPIGIVGDFYYPGLRPTNFAEQARVFEQAPIGTRMAFPVHPLGFAPLELTKR